MKDYSHLFGDAKATARRSDASARGNELEEAREGYSAAQDVPDAIKRYAEALVSANKLEEAEKLYSEYVALAPADQDAYYELALLNKLIGRIERAHELFTRVVEMAPSSSLARSAEYEMWALDGKGGQSWARK